MTQIRKDNILDPTFPEALSQGEAPYFEALQTYVDTKVLTFHVPGHQQGKGSPPEFREFFRKSGLVADITQVLGMDDIHRPVSVCKRAQELAAAAYGADKTYFLINGSSSGNQAMLLSALRPGEKVLIPRNAHRSTMAALILSGAMAVFYEPPYDNKMYVDHAPTVEIVRAALKKHPDVKAVYFTSPTYYGAAADTKALVELAHEHGVLALADEAWGAHLKFSSQLPMSAVTAGADMVVQSTHKMLSGMTQAALLHVNGDRIDRARLESVLQMFLSTSPSCLMVASIDSTRRQMALQGEELLGEVIELSQYARTKINQIKGIRCHGEEMLERPGVHGWDPSRLVITGIDQGYSGYEIERYLREFHNIQVEMAELFNVVALVTLGHEKEHLERLVHALQFLPRKEPNFDLRKSVVESENRRGQPFELPDFPEQQLTMRQAFDAPYETVPIADSVGRISAEMITTYPPGIPMVVPGELFKQELLDYIRIEQAAGSNIQGAFDPSLKTVRVVSGAAPKL